MSKWHILILFAVTKENTMTGHICNVHLKKNCMLITLIFAAYIKKPYVFHAKV